MLSTPRLILRRWLDSDLAPFAEMNADPRVMLHFPALLTRAESDAGVARVNEHFERHGFGPFACELRETGAFIGFVGISVPNFQAPFMPAVEIGWRLAAGYWNRGLATEGAREVLRYAFEDLRLPEIVAFTVPANTPSRRVMEKLGMTRDPADDFEHPNLPAGHPLRLHALYRLKNGV